MSKLSCNFAQHAIVIRAFRENGKYGEAPCPQCGRNLQLGLSRCPHGSLIEKGKTLCESCKTGPGDSRVSPEQVAEFLKDTPAIPDTELQAHEPQEVTDSETDTTLLNAEI